MPIAVHRDNNIITVVVTEQPDKTKGIGSTKWTVARENNLVVGRLTMPVNSASVLLRGLVESGVNWND
jgi:hypothetical protein